MDPAKLRLFAGIGGALFGFAGIVALLVAAAIALAPLIGSALSVVVVGIIFFAIGCTLIALFLKPMKSTADELDQLESATAEAFADLPLDTIKAIIVKHPIATTAVAGVVGYGFMRDPGTTGKMLQRTLLGLL